MRLRPHHLLCIQKFTGHGYDEAFTAHMTKLTAALKQEPETPVTLVRGCDALCARCPNNEEGACNSLEKVARMDEAALAACSLSYGDTAPWSRLAAAARERIFQTAEFHRVCAACQWYALCGETEPAP